MQEWITVAEQNNLALKVQQAVYEIAKQDVERAKAGHYPTVDLVAIYSDQKGVGGTITGRPIDLTSKEIGVQVSFPIFQGFASPITRSGSIGNARKGVSGSEQYPAQ